MWPSAPQKARVDAGDSARRRTPVAGTDRVELRLAVLGKHHRDRLPSGDQLGAEPPWLATTRRWLVASAASTIGFFCSKDIVGQALAVGRPRGRDDRLARAQRGGGVHAVGVGDLEPEVGPTDHVGDAGGSAAGQAGELHTKSARCGGRPGGSMPGSSAFTTALSHLLPGFCGACAGSKSRKRDRRSGRRRTRDQAAGGAPCAG